MRIKKQKTKKSVIKRKLKLGDCKNCLETTQLKNRINHLQKNEITVDSFKKGHKEFIKTIN